MARVRLYVWMPSSGKHYQLGHGHSAVEVLTPERNKYWITRLTRRGLGGVVLLPNTEAARGVGFTQIRDKRGKVVEKPDTRGIQKAMSHERNLELRDHLPANFIFDVPVSHTSCELFGVSTHRMERYWRRILKSPPGHPTRRDAVLSTRDNCHGVVVDALLAGGLGIYAKPPKNFVYRDARTLVHWVEEAIQHINRMNRWCATQKPVQGV